jgi:hypothetical protein
MASSEDDACEIMRVGLCRQGLGSEAARVWVTALGSKSLFLWEGRLLQVDTFTAKRSLYTGSPGYRSI